MYFTCCLNVRGITPMKQAALDAALLAFKVFDGDSYINEEEGIIEYYSGDEVNWDTVEEDMIRLSTLFPAATFKLICGMEGDRWDYYFHNGDMEYCAWQPKKPTKIIW